MQSKFEGMTVNLGGFEAKFVFPSSFGKKPAVQGTVSEKPPHIHYDSEIHFILSGEYAAITDKTEYRLPKNSVCIIPKGISHLVTPLSADVQCFNMLISLEPLRVKSKTKNGLRRKVQALESLKEIQVFENADRVCDYIRDFTARPNSRDGAEEYIRRSIMTLVLFSVIELAQKRSPCFSQVARACEINSYDGSFFDAELENYLMLHYREKISREQVASHIGISTAQLGRIIRKNYGMNYSSLITALRMTEAKKLLAQDTALCEIAKSLGFTTYNGFAAAFRRVFGKAPDDVRRELGNKNKGEKL